MPVDRSTDDTKEVEFTAFADSVFDAHDLLLAAVKAGDLTQDAAERELAQMFDVDVLNYGALNANAEAMLGLMGSGMAQAIIIHKDGTFTFQNDPAWSVAIHEMTADIAVPGPEHIPLLYLTYSFLLKRHPGSVITLWVSPDGALHADIAFVSSNIWEVVAHAKTFGFPVHFLPGPNKGDEAYSLRHTWGAVAGYEDWVPDDAYAVIGSANGGLAAIADDETIIGPPPPPPGWDIIDEGDIEGLLKALMAHAAGEIGSEPE